MQILTFSLKWPYLELSKLKISQTHIDILFNFSQFSTFIDFLAHLSQRLNGDLIG